DWSSDVCSSDLMFDTHMRSRYHGDMSKLTALHEAMSRLDAVWADAEDSNDLTRAELVSVTDAVAQVQRRLDAVQVDVAAGLARESRVELGPDSLAKQQGYRTPGKMLAATLGVSTGDALRLIKVGEGTAPRTDLVGAKLPAKYPLVREALRSGTVSAQGAAMIIDLLERCRIVAGAERIAEGEKMLADTAAGLGLDDLRKLVTRAEAWLDPDGVEPREDEKRSRRSLTLFERDGMVHFSGRMDAETAAPVVTALRGYVSAAFAARKDAIDPAAPDADHRTVAMIQADALSVFCSHMLGCSV